MAVVKAVCTSEVKGVAKKNIGKCMLIEDFGLENDAHAGKWHRQVSLLSDSSRCDFEEKAEMKIEDGAFGENLLIDGLKVDKLPIGTILKIGDCRIEISQIGKECHKGCAIRDRVGDCIMPREGVFAKVLKGGLVQVGDKVKIEKISFRYGILTVSDKGYQGKREDLSSLKIAEKMEELSYELVKKDIVPDDQKMIEEKLKEYTDQDSLDLVLTTGGTGLSPRDFTPEATMRVIEREVPGIAEAMRAKSMEITDKAQLSRARSGIRNKTLIINLPGSPKAVSENIDVFKNVLNHALEILTGIGGECGDIK